MNERAFAFRPWLLAGLLRPVLFGLALAAGVLAGERSGSFWIGLIAFFIASGAGRALRRLLRGRAVDAVYEALWPAAATGLVILFLEIGLPSWAAVLLAFVAAGVVKGSFAAAFLPPRSGRRRWRIEVGLPGVDEVVEGRWREKEER